MAWLQQNLAENVTWRRVAKTGRAAPGFFCSPWNRWGPLHEEITTKWTWRFLKPPRVCSSCWFWKVFSGNVSRLVMFALRETTKCVSWDIWSFFCWDPKGCFIYHSRVTSCNHFTIVTNGMAMKYLIFGDVTINALIQSRLIYDDIMTPHVFAGRFIHGIFKPTYTIDLSILL